jgi:hypothetical protein
MRAPRIFEARPFGRETPGRDGASGRDVRVARAREDAPFDGEDPLDLSDTVSMIRTEC